MKVKNTKNVYDCRKIRMSHHTRKRKAKVRAIPMEEDKTLESESSTRHDKIDEQSYRLMFQRFMESNGNNAN